MACRGGSCKVKRSKRAAPPAVSPAMPQNALANVGSNLAQWNQVAPMSTMSAQPQQKQSGWQKFKKGAKEFFVGSDPQQMQFPIYNQPQQQLTAQAAQAAQMLLNQLQQNPAQAADIMPALTNILGFLRQGQTNLDFEPIAEKARMDFGQRTIPSIAERFSSLGAQRSSAFPQALSQAGANLETNLAALRAGHGLDVARFGLAQQQLAGQLGLSQNNLQQNMDAQRQNMLSNLLSVGLTPQYQTALTQGSRGLLGPLAAGAGMLGASYLMGGAPTALSAAPGALNSVYNAFTPSNGLFQT